MKSNLKVGWKVVSVNDDGTFRSSHMGLTYFVGQWTKPDRGKGPLCVFRTKQAAIKFCERSARLDFLPCIYVPSKLKFVWVDKVSRCSLDALTPGKVLANKVMILKEVL